MSVCMNIKELRKKINEFNDIPETNKNWDSREMNYENEYILVVSLDDSNKHNFADYNKFDKMWSIIYLEKQSFKNLPNFKIFQEEFNAYISSVRKGKNKGCFAIRIPDMKQSPSIKMANEILEFIFNV